MGNIASPDIDVWPLQEVERLWDGKMPVFANELEVNRFMQTLVNDFYNKLCDQQEIEKPFNLIKLKPGHIDHQYLARLGNIRREELEGFLGGLFCGLDEMEMPEKAREIIHSLLEKREMFSTAEKAANDPQGPSGGSSIEQMHESLQEMTLAAESQINVIIQLVPA